MCGLLLLTVILLGAGSQLLSSIVSVILSLREGNPLPFIVAILIPVVVITYAGRIDEEGHLKSIMALAGYATGAYMIATLFLALLPMGLLISILGAAVMGGISALLYDPSHLEQLGTFHPRSVIRMQLINDAESGPSPAFISGIATQWTLLLIKQEEREKILDMLQERPLLPVSFSVFLDSDVLVIHSRDASEVDKVRKCLAAYSIEDYESASGMMTEIVCAIPLIDEKNGISFSEYRFSQSEETIQTILRRPPVRSMFIPDKNGLTVVLPERLMPGLEMDTIPKTQRIACIVGREQRHFSHGDSKNASKA